MAQEQQNADLIVLQRILPAVRFTHNSICQSFMDEQCLMQDVLQNNENMNHGFQMKEGFAIYYRALHFWNINEILQHVAILDS